jgi:putative Mg2+ transporter-C (MgtC) family protein
VSDVTTAFGAATGQGWDQIGYLAIALALSLCVGVEREAQQKSAGIRTYPLVGLGAALFVLLSKYGFGDVLSDSVKLDPSRVAAQIVTGVGFIGGGLIFVRRDVVRGLTTAASVWLTAAIGACAGAGLVVVAAVTTGLYFVVIYALKPIGALLERVRPASAGVRITYVDGRGVLRQVLNTITERGFLVAELTTVRGEHADESGSDDRRDREVAQGGGDSVEVTLVLSGRGDLGELSSAVSELDGVLAVRTGPPGTD